MNRSGQFKNIEEFKATSGGLMAFFDHEKPELRERILEDLAARAVGLMAWREVGEVLPYYCEGLIHLALLHEAEGLEIDGVAVRVRPESYDEVKVRYRNAYRDLALHYVTRQDAAEYLGRYARKEGEIWLPVDPALRSFVEAWYERYQRIGQQVAADFE